MAAPIASVRAELARMRADRAAWTELVGDEAEHLRGAVLLGMQYDRRDDDQELVRYLLEQEVICHETSDLQGLEAQLRLACYLVARRREVEDIWMLTRAKLANYDTFSGLDREYLYAAGVDAIAAYVRGSSHEQRDRVLGELFAPDGTRWFSDDELATWWTWVTKFFPDQPEAEHPLSMTSHALDYGTAAEAWPWLERWATGPAHEHEPERAWGRDLAATIARDPELAPRVAALDL